MQILVKNTLFLSSFSCFEQVATNAIDPHHNRILAKSRRTAERPTVHLKIYEYYDSPNIKTNDTLS